MLMPILASAVTDWLLDHLLLLVGAVVVVLGLAVVGRADVPRFSWQRVWAISGVCFSESVRRRILWIIPLAIIGLIAVVQLQQPSDEQDAIRQTTKFCLFASGLVVVLSTLILACTNLPREIENRVIFLVVTKPTTRLEIVLGKVVGFARVSFIILLTMGAFTFGYLHLRAQLLTADLRHRLETPGEVESVSVPTFTHYVNAGLLNAKTLADPVKMDIFGRPPVPGSKRRYLNGDGYMLVPFFLPPNMAAFVDPESKNYKGSGMTVHMKLGGEVSANAGPTVPASQPGAAKTPPVPLAVNVQVFDPNVNTAVSNPPGPVQVVDPTGNGVTDCVFTVGQVSQVLRLPFIYVVLAPFQNGQSLFVDEDPAHPPVTITAPVVDANGQVSNMELTPRNPAQPDQPGDFTFTGRDGSYGQQVKGDANGAGQTCVYRFRELDISVPAGVTSVPIEMRVGVEKGGEATTKEIPTDMRLTVAPIDGAGKSADTQVLHPENNRPLYAAIPADLARSGNFDITIQCLSNDQWVGLKPLGLSIVKADSSFAWNLTKSLTILWLLSILVTAISVFCSTFLTWPTAVVFTLVLLLGRWALNELGDAASAGLGRQFVSEFGVRDVALTTTVASSVDKLNAMFKAVASVLPDISAFSATDQIDRGISIPIHTLFDALFVLVGFGLPLTVAAYIILKNKEVAP